MFIKLKKICIYMSLCVCHMCMGAHGSRRRVPGPWSYGYSYMLWTAGCGCWESDFGPLGGQPLITRPLSRPFWDLVKIPTKSHSIDQPSGSTLEILMPQVWPRVKEFTFQMNFKERLIQLVWDPILSRVGQASPLLCTALWPFSVSTSIHVFFLQFLLFWGKGGLT